MCLKWRSNERKWPFRGLSLTSLNVISQPIESGRETLSSSAFITSHAKSNRSLHPARSQQEKPSPSPHPKPKGRAIEMHNYIYNEIYICIRYCSYKHSTFRLHHQPCQVQQKPDALNLQPTFSHKPIALNLQPWTFHLQPSSQAPFGAASYKTFPIPSVFVWGATITLTTDTPRQAWPGRLQQNIEMFTTDRQHRSLCLFSYKILVWERAGHIPYKLRISDIPYFYNV